MGQPISVSGWRGRRTPVRFQNRDACLDALVTDIHGRTSHKPLNLVAGSAAEGAAQSRLRAQPLRQPPELRHPSRILYPRFARAKQPARVFEDRHTQQTWPATRRPGAGPRRAVPTLAGSALLVLVLLEEFLARNLLLAHGGQFEQEIDHFLLEDGRPYRCQRAGILLIELPHFLLASGHLAGALHDRAC